MSRRIWTRAAIAVLVLVLGIGTMVVVRIGDAVGRVSGERLSLWDTLRLLVPGGGDTWRRSDMAAADASGSTIVRLPLTDGDRGAVREPLRRSRTEGLETFAPATPVANDPLALPRGDYLPLDPNRLDVLLLGIRGSGDARGGLLTDAILIASIDLRSGRTALVSIPRDLYVPIPEASDWFKINAAYALGHRGGGRGVDLALAVVGRTTGVPLTHAVVADMSGFERLVDLLGGIDVQVGRDFSGMESEGLEVRAGAASMDGPTALMYARSRKTTSDFDRSRRQREIVRALQARIADIRNPLLALDVLDLLAAHVSTTMSAHELRSAVDSLGAVTPAMEIERGFDTSDRGLLDAMRSSKGEAILVPRSGDFRELQAAVREALLGP